MEKKKLSSVYGKMMVRTEIVYFAKNVRFNITCGINLNGDLFLGDGCSGYNLPDTPENRQKVLDDFMKQCHADYVNTDYVKLVIRR